MGAGLGRQRARSMYPLESAQMRPLRDGMVARSTALWAISHQLPRCGAQRRSDTEAPLLRQSRTSRKTHMSKPTRAPTALPSMSDTKSLRRAAPSLGITSEPSPLTYLRNPTGLQSRALQRQAKTTASGCLPRIMGLTPQVLRGTIVIYGPNGLVCAGGRPLCHRWTCRLCTSCGNRSRRRLAKPHLVAKRIQRRQRHTLSLHQPLASCRRDDRHRRRRRRPKQAEQPHWVCDLASFPRLRLPS